MQLARSLSVLLVAGPLALLSPAPQAARSLTVVGSGSAAVEPTIAVLQLYVSAADERPSDALATMRDRRIAVLEALTAFEGYDVSTTAYGGNVRVKPEVSAGRGVVIINGRVREESSKTEYLWTERIAARITPSEPAPAVEGVVDLQTVAVVALDAAIEAGAEAPKAAQSDTSMLWLLGAAPSVVAPEEPQPLLVYELPEAAAHIAFEAASTAAIEDARRKAAALARDAGLQLGGPVSLRVIEDLPLRFTSHQPSRATLSVEVQFAVE